MAESSTGAGRLVSALQAAGIRDRRVLDACGRVPRERFVPAGSENQAPMDQPIRIGLDQVTTQPSLVGRMVEGLRLEGHERVLEVGTGYGYQTAILAELAAEVWSIERFEELASVGRANLRAAGYGSVEVVVGDGTLGLPDHAPYHAIVVSAAAPAVPPPLAGQLAEGGRLVMPVGPGGDDEVTAFRKERGHLRHDAWLCHAYFVPLVGLHGLPHRSVVVDPPERSPRGHRLIAHTADAGLAASAARLEELFEEAAAALADLGGAEDAGTAPGERLEERIGLEADDLQGMVYAWLNELIGLAEVRHAAVQEASVERVERVDSAWRLDASVWLVPYRSGGTPPGRHVKAATYHGLEIGRDATGWHLTAYLDL
jgi:protein-L-isoaspartate(D-aspartate) O-methyltransferase